MASPWHVRTGVRAGVAAGVLLLLAVAFPAPKAWGQGANMILQACRRIELRQIVAGSQVYYTQCTDRFTTADPYIVVVIHLRNVRQSITVVGELLDPEQATVWSLRRSVTPPLGSDIIYSDLWYFGILPVAEEPRKILADNPSWLFSMILPSGKPTRERLGGWTFRVSLNSGPQQVRAFTLAAAPGAPTPAPTPTPAQSPTPEATPSP